MSQLYVESQIRGFLLKIALSTLFHVHFICLTYVQGTGLFYPTWIAEVLLL